jgi:hypothetical protein
LYRYALVLVPLPLDMDDDNNANVLGYTVIYPARGRLCRDDDPNSTATRTQSSFGSDTAADVTPTVGPTDAPDDADAPTTVAPPPLDTDCCTLNSVMVPAHLRWGPCYNLNPVYP